MPTRTISVRTVQEGLTYWSRVESRGLTDDAPSPGRIDGRWGPVTHEALRAYVAFHAGQHGGYDSARVMAPLRSLPRRAVELELELYFVSRLQTHALLYRGQPRTPPRREPAPPRDEPGRVRPPPDRSGTSSPAAPDRSSDDSSGGGMLGPLLGIGAAVLAAGATLAVVRARRNKRDEVYDDELLEPDWT